MVKRMWAGMTDPAGFLALQNQAMRAHPLPMLVGRGTVSTLVKKKQLQFMIN